MWRTSENASAVIFSDRSRSEVCAASRLAEAAARLSIASMGRAARRGAAHRPHVEEQPAVARRTPLVEIPPAVVADQMRCVEASMTLISLSVSLGEKTLRHTRNSGNNFRLGSSRQLICDRVYHVTAAAYSHCATHSMRKPDEDEPQLFVSLPMTHTALLSHWRNAAHGPRCLQLLTTTDVRIHSYENAV